MRIGRQRTSENMVFSLEKVIPSSSSSSDLLAPGSSSSSAPGSSSSSAPGSSSSSAPGSSSSSAPGSSSSSAPCGIFDSSITTVLGANQDFPGQYFAVGLGVAISTIGASGTLFYNNLGLSGVAIITDISIQGVIVGTITISASYAGRDMAFEYMGNVYCGVFIDGTLEYQ